MAAARDRVPTLQDFMDEDFEIKQINDNISRANAKINRVDKEIKQLIKTQKKYNRNKKTKDNAKKYFFELYAGMTPEDFEDTYKNEGENSISMYRFTRIKRKEGRTKSC